MGVCEADVDYPLNCCTDNTVNSHNFASVLGRNM